MFIINRTDFSVGTGNLEETHATCQTGCLKSAVSVRFGLDLGIARPVPESRVEFGTGGRRKCVGIRARVQNSKYGGAGAAQQCRSGFPAL